MKISIITVSIAFFILSGISFSQDYVKLKALDRAMKCTIIEANDSLVVFQKSNSSQILQAITSDIDWYFYADGSGINFSGKEVTQSDFDNAYEYKASPRKTTETPEAAPQKVKPTQHIPFTKNPDERVSIEMNLLKYFSSYSSNFGLTEEKASQGPFMFDIGLTIPSSNDVSVIFKAGYYYESWDFSEASSIKQSGAFIRAGVKFYLPKEKITP
ncbi:MAG: hypothetical protein JSU85_13600 [Candidatus Zixiibacteriota bacterium]|nr:MAG: hypothetical protein JSU85_13600 [candidate division Zixibacteria bacterium]